MQHLTSESVLKDVCLWVLHTRTVSLDVCVLRKLYTLVILHEE